MGIDLLAAKLFLVILLLLFMISSLVDASPLSVYCSNDEGSYTPNSQFENNLKLLLESLSFNTFQTSGSQTNFTGDGSDRVYGEAVCQDGVTPTDCQNCIQEAKREILDQCKTKEAIIWYESCQVRYSLKEFFSLMINSGKIPKEDEDESISISNYGRYGKVLMYLMTNLAAAGAFDMSKPKFAAGEVKFSENGTIYGLAECTRDVTRCDCKSCLQAALKDLNECCRQRQGGIVVSMNCVMRFELYRFYNASSMPLTYTPTAGGKSKVGMLVAVTCVPTFVILAVVTGACYVYRKRKKSSIKDEERTRETMTHDLARPLTAGEESDVVNWEESLFMDLATIKAATDGFSDSNKLGQGGFGSVYKGVLQNGKEVAVKRLSGMSRQGLEEFRNEIFLIAKLQHRNLVRLVGCGIEGEEKLLVYEFMPNKSLDFFIFDSVRRTQLDWKNCYNIITGIARGLLYLHEDSRLKIIHRDLKPSNVLLDKEMVAKISDFGMARTFYENQNTANTKRVMGTFGYMAPEYAMEGLFSVKSDVFSFGVIVLEIISGKRNTSFHLTGHAETLLTYAWQLWNEGKQMELVDPILRESCPTPEVLRCIHIGLLCVQEDLTNRPTMSHVVALLGSESISLPEPKQPAISVGGNGRNDQPSTIINPSANYMSISSMLPR